MSDREAGRLWTVVETAGGDGRRAMLFNGVDNVTVPPETWPSRVDFAGYREGVSAGVSGYVANIRPKIDFEGQDGQELITLVVANPFAENNVSELHGNQVLFDASRREYPYVTESTRAAIVHEEYLDAHGVEKVRRPWMDLFQILDKTKSRRLDMQNTVFQVLIPAETKSAIALLLRGFPTETVDDGYVEQEVYRVYVAGASDGGIFIHHDTNGYVTVTPEFLLQYNANQAKCDVLVVDRNSNGNDEYFEAVLSTRAPTRRVE